MKLRALKAFALAISMVLGCGSDPVAERPLAPEDAGSATDAADTSAPAIEASSLGDVVVTSQLPKDPSGLVLEIVDETTVKLVWVNNADNADNFELRWSPNDILPAAANATVPVDMTTHLATGLTSGQEYHFWVRAVNAKGTSNDVMGIITPVPVPLQPQSVLAIAGPSGTVTLAWDDVTDEVGYNVYWSADVTKPAMPNKKVATDTVSTEVTGLDPCTTYHFWVEAFNPRAAGQAGQTTSKAETAPADPTALSVQVAGSNATVTWKDNADNESDYTIYWAKGTGALQPATGTSAGAKMGTGGTVTYVIKTLQAGSAYTVWVDAKNCIGTSNAISGPANTVPLPLAPTGFTATITGAASDTLHLSWTNQANDAKGYRVYYATTMAIPAMPGVDNLPVSATSTDITGLTPLTTYYFWIVAFNDSGESNPALTGTAAVGKAPVSPVGLAVDAASSKFKMVVTWTGGDATTQSYKINWTVDGVTANVDPVAVAGDQTSYTLAEVYANSSYVFSLQASNVVGDSAPVSSSPVGSFQIPGHGPTQAAAIREAWIESNGFLHFGWWVGNGPTGDAGNGNDAVAAMSYASYWSNSTQRPGAGFPNNQTLGATYYYWTSNGFNVPYPRYLWAEGKGADGSLFWFHKLIPGPDMTGAITFSNVMDTAITLTWPAQAGANGYRVWKSTSTVHPTDNGSAAVVGTTTYTATNLDTGTVYYFWVEATGPAYNNGPSMGGMSGAPILGNAKTTGISYILIPTTGLTAFHNTTFGVTATHPTEVIPGAPCCMWSDGRAFDANTGTLWGYTDGSWSVTAGQIDQFGSPPNPPWVGVDLGQAVTIALIRLTWEGAFTRVYKLEGSNDQTTWTTLVDVQCDPTIIVADAGMCPVANQFHTVQDVSQKFFISDTTPYRYVRLLIPSPNQTDYVNTGWGVKIRDIALFRL